ncbi:Hypothetical protein, putative [Bodo saltans]|uniref:Uncharacterized protein n=1 Tax=Bodo saltans TaxID=75058 RepID=A0A0S4IPH0_BODSA|nr:Hypothetical protein, putative [Bodo saltans]|eukprot:CUF06160.1 Hypothetical protein, putative [Bodo saltans]
MTRKVLQRLVEREPKYKKMEQQAFWVMSGDGHMAQAQLSHPAYAQHHPSHTTLVQMAPPPQQAYYYQQPVAPQPQASFAVLPSQGQTHIADPSGHVYAYHQHQPQQQVFWVQPQQPQQQLFTTAQYTVSAPQRPPQPAVAAQPAQAQQYYVIGANGVLQPATIPQAHSTTTPPGSLSYNTAATAVLQAPPLQPPPYPGGPTGAPPPFGAASGGVVATAAAQNPLASAGQIFASSMHSSLTAAAQQQQQQHMQAAGRPMNLNLAQPPPPPPQHSLRNNMHAGSMGVGPLGSKQMPAAGGSSFLKGRPSTGNASLHQPSTIGGAVGPRPLSHAAEQPVPGTIHSVRPFLGPKGIGSILDTPSKLPLLDALPPLARKKPGPVRIPQRDLLL